MGHLRRFSAQETRAAVEACGLKAIEVKHLNKTGAPAWWFFGKVLRREKINKLPLKLFDKMVWLFRHIDWLLPWSGLSLVVVARRER
jgi:hypothetical protein